jgi:hypothetical protein
LVKKKHRTAGQKKILSKNRLESHQKIPIEVVQTLVLCTYLLAGFQQKKTPWAKNDVSKSYSPTS